MVTQIAAVPALTSFGDGTPGWFALVCAVIFSYALGSLSPADFAARRAGADIREVGSGNPGATNAARAMGVKVGVIVGLLDVMKGALPAWFFARYGAPAGQLAGLSAVLGHITSPLLQGRGGKGVATSLGAILAIYWPWAVVVLAVFGISFAFTRKVGVSSAIGSVLLLPLSMIWFRSWWDVAFAAGLAALVLWRHRKNLDAFRKERLTRHGSTS